MSAAREWKLATLLEGLCTVPRDQDVVVTGLCTDSRVCRPGDLFMALAGQRRHGLDYLALVQAAGAVAVLYDPSGAEPEAQCALPRLSLAGLRGQVGVIADRFFGAPSRTVTVTGVTGTNGKTSVCHFIAQGLDRPEARCALLGTLGNGLPGALQPTRFTTPDAVALHGMLAEFRDLGARRAVLEVSSHALDQERVAGIAFTTAVFTNLTHDHLDYHGDSDSYAAAKRLLFTRDGLEHAVLNLDDPVGRAWAGDLRGRVEVLGYGFTAAAEVRGRELTLGTDGIAFSVDTPHGSGRIESPLLGRFNASNLLAALGALLANGVAFDAALARIARLEGVPGRMERFGGGAQPLVVVDYAHTPDALAGALLSLREHGGRRLWCVFGCGGERDRLKRPVMGALAEQHADRVVVTDDNPRGEDGDAIVAEILAGMHMPGSVTVIRERAAALAEVLAEATADDVVLVAGKGHETTREAGGQHYPWSDRDAVRALLEARP